MRRAEPVEHSSSRIGAGLQNDQAVASSRSVPSNPSLQLALANSSIEERQVLEAVLIDGLPYAEVAAGCGESVGSIKNRLRSGLSKLRRSLEDRGGEA